MMEFDAEDKLQKMLVEELSKSINRDILKRIMSLSSTESNLRRIKQKIYNQKNAN